MVRDTDMWRTSKREGRTDPECWYELGEGDEEEVEVEEELELFVEYDGEEGECIVLLVSYDVGWKSSAEFV